MSDFIPTDLIKEVKIRPGIYNRESLTPPRKDHRHQLWLEVAECLTPREEWESYTEEEKEMRVCEVSNKWKNLRDHFYREVKLLESGDDNKKRKYIYFNEMEFVRPYVGYKRPPVNKRQKKSVEAPNISHDFRDDDSDIDMGEFLKKKTKVEGVQQRFKTMPVKKNTQTSQKKKFYAKTTSGSNRSQKEADIDNFIVLEKTGADKNPAFKIRESDISFCLSLVPTLRQMSDLYKLSAKIDILKVLRRNMANMQSNEQESNVEHDKSNDNNEDTDYDDLVEECGYEVKVKDDPLNENDTKAWW